MYALINDVVYKVKFAHFEDTVDPRLIGRGVLSHEAQKLRKQTRVSLYVVTGDNIAKEPSMSAVAITHPNDNFCRFTGRKVAFARLMKQFPRKERLSGWGAFFSENED